MADDKRFNLVVFGATGFTGQYVAEEVARIAGEENITWAVAGRNEKKLKVILQNVEKNTGIKSLTIACTLNFLYSWFLKGISVDNVGIVIANVDDQDSLNEMAKVSGVVLNCVGPYRFYGEAVVKACVENGASHVDISGEPQVNCHFIIQHYLHKTMDSSFNFCTLKHSREILRT